MVGLGLLVVGRRCSENRGCSIGLGRRLQSSLKYRSMSAAFFSASTILDGGLTSNTCPISVFRPRMKSVTESFRILSFIARLVISSEYSFVTLYCSLLNVLRNLMI